MKQALLEIPEKIIFIDEKKPIPNDDEVMIEVKFAGICGSDIHAYYGKHPFISCPIIQGHEFSGIISEVGANVSGFKVGDNVTVMPQYYCGECEPCKNGRYNICDGLKVMGCQAPGGYSEYFACSASLVKKLPDKMDLKIGATVEPVAVGVHAIKRGADIKGKNVVVIGAGMIGNVTAQSAMAEGAKSVLIVDMSDYRLGVASECGIPHVANVGKKQMEEAIFEAFGDEGCDIFLECVGVASGINKAIELSKKGHDIIIVGVYGKVPEVNMSLVQDKELRLIGSLMYLEKDYDDAIRYLDEGKIVTDKLISKICDFDELPEAYKYIEKNKDVSLKVLLKI